MHSRSRPTTSLRPIVPQKHLTTPKSTTHKFDKSSQNSFSSSFSSKSRSAKTASTPIRIPGRFSINEKNETVIQNFNFTPSSYIDHTQSSIDSDADQMRDQLFLSFDLLKTMTPKNCVRYLNRSPLFLKTMFTEGRLDPDLISSVTLSLTQNELQAFVQNMTQELNIFSAIHLCETFQDAEEQILNLVPLTKVIIWSKSEYTDFVYSPSMKMVLAMGKSIVCWPFTDKQDIVTADPGDHPGFNINFDLPYLRTTKSMMILPVFWPNGEISSIIQCIGLKDPSTDSQIEFTSYYIEVLKIIRDILQKKFFSQIPDKVIPSNIPAIFGELEKCSLSATVTQITKYLQNEVPCENADLFEFDDRTKILTRLNDNTKYDEENGGISYKAAMSQTPINLPHSVALETLKTEIDQKTSNRSILSTSLFYHRQHFVVTLRAKPNSPAFNSFDSQLVTSLTPLICDSLKLSKWLEKQAADISKVKEDMKLMLIVNDTLANVSSDGCDRWEAIKKASFEFFNCDDLFIALFDGRFMKFTPTEIKCKFEECTAGTAYNYRETVWGRPEDDKCKFNKSLYEELKVDCKDSLAFPYRTGGRVAGAIELINPKQTEIDAEKQKLFGSLCACLLGNSQS